MSIGMHTTDHKTTELLVAYFLQFFLFLQFLQAFSHTPFDCCGPCLGLSDKAMTFEYFCWWKHNVFDAARIVFGSVTLFYSCGVVLHGPFYISVFQSLIQLCISDAKLCCFRRKPKFSNGHILLSSAISSSISKTLCYL